MNKAPNRGRFFVAQKRSTATSSNWNYTAGDYAGYADNLGDKEQRNVPSVRSTSIIRRDPYTIAVRYHETDVLTYHDDGTCTFNSGGWLTYTTKDRMNVYGPAGCRIYQARGEWRLITRSGEYPYADGITVRIADGTIVGGAPDVSEARAHNKAMMKKITRYCAGITPQLLRDLREQGSAGDCWYCCMSVLGTNGQSLGDATCNAKHLESHLDEGYYMLSLICNALQEKEYGNPGVVYEMTTWKDADGSYGIIRDVRRAVRDYLKNRLLTGPALRRGAGSRPSQYFTVRTGS